MSMLMVELVWDFVTVVYSDDKLGMESYQSFEKFATKYYICVDKAISASSKLSIEIMASIQTVGVVYLGSEGVGMLMCMFTFVCWSRY